MLDLRDRIAANLADVRRRIVEACERAGRPSSATQLIAVTKSVGLEEIRILLDLGVRHVAENRLGVAMPKIEALGSSCDGCWHMIGSLQRRKIRDIVQVFDRVDAVDRIEVADTLQKHCEMLDKTLPILVQVNVSGEASKHGFAPEDLPTTLDHIRTLPNVQVEGLMTMAPFFDDPERTRPVFARLRELAERHGLRELSMGMTNDFEVAIEEGATQVRIGSALFN